MGSLSFRCCGCWRYKIVCSQETLAKVCRGVDKCPPEKPLMYINFLEREGKNRLNYFGKCLAAKVGEGGFFLCLLDIWEAAAVGPFPPPSPPLTFELCSRRRWKPDPKKYPRRGEPKETASWVPAATTGRPNDETVFSQPNGPSSPPSVRLSERDKSRWKKSSKLSN